MFTLDKGKRELPARFKTKSCRCLRSLGGSLGDEEKLNGGREFHPCSAAAGFAAPNSGCACGFGRLGCARAGPRTSENVGTRRGLPGNRGNARNRRRKDARKSLHFERE